MKCTKCGNALHAGERFCGECGTAVAGVPPAASRRDIFLGIGGTAIVASGLTYLVTRGPSASSPATPTLAPTIPVPTRAPSLPAATAAQMAPTIVAARPTATAVPPTPEPPTATAVPPTPEPPTATAVPPTPPPPAIAVPPTATWVPPTPASSGPKRLIVDASGSGDYRTIASAILGARPQDTIVLRPGTYKESLSINRDVRIVGEGGQSKVIVEGAPGAHVFGFTAGSATLTGMTIRILGSGLSTGAITVRAGTPVIEDCDLTSSAGAAVYILGATANPVIRNCTMRNSRDSGVVYEQGQGTIEQCVIAGNALMGVQIRTGGNPVVRDCEIRDNKGYGVSVLEQGQGTFTGNTLTGNANGAWYIAPTAGRVTRTGNTPNA